MLYVKKLVLFMDKIPILLLAAGSSSRMGQPKQLLRWGNQSLIEHQMETLKIAGNPFGVVLGANSEAILPVIEKFGVDIFINPNWKNGMGNSVAFGIHQLLQKFPGAEGALITLVDQPLITSSYIEKILEIFHPGEQQIIVSKSSSGWRGVPVLFDKIYFEKLQKLDGEKGAKILIQQYKNSIIEIECGEMLQDLDTPESYQRLKSQFMNIGKDTTH